MNYHYCLQQSTKVLRLYANLPSVCPELPTYSKFLILLSSSRALMTRHLSYYILAMCLMIPLSNFLYSTSLMLASLIFLIFLSFRSRLHSSLSFSDRQRIFSWVQKPFYEHLVTIVPFFSYYDLALFYQDSVWFSCEEGSLCSSEESELEEDWLRDISSLDGSSLEGEMGESLPMAGTGCSWRTIPFWQETLRLAAGVFLGSLGDYYWDFSLMCSLTSSRSYFFKESFYCPGSLNSEPRLEARLEDLDLFSSSISSMPIQLTLLSIAKAGLSEVRTDGLSNSFFFSSNSLILSVFSGELECSF